MFYNIDIRWRNLQHTVAVDYTDKPYLVPHTVSHRTPYLEAVDAAEEADGVLAGVLLGHVHDAPLVAVLRLQDVIIAAHQQLSQTLRVS